MTRYSAVYAGWELWYVSVDSRSNVTRPHFRPFPALPTTQTQQVSLVRICLACSIEVAANCDIVVSWTIPFTAVATSVAAILTQYFLGHRLVELVFLSIPCD